MSLQLLLLDDDAVDRQAVRRTLRAAEIDASLSEAATADEAFALLTAGRFDCILLDYYLPDTDGLAVLHRLRSAGVDAPVIALTGQADQETAVALMKAGAADYLAKGSLTPESLERSLRHALQVAAGERERRELLAREQAARREAQAANRAKDEFLATLSHELRTPLTSILGWTRLLTGGALDAAGTARALETIQRNVRLQAKLIDDLLDISRIVTGKLTVERQPVLLATVVAASVESHRPAAGSAHVELTYAPPAEERAVIGDSARLQQVVANLLSNALKFTPPGGTVHVTLDFTETEAHLNVTDSGTGIAADFLPHVFEQFRQADASTTRRQGGLGLGLAIVRTIVELHGGTVVAESAGPGTGATFRVTLPTANVPVKPSRDLPVEDTRLDGISVLVVDDDPDGRVLIGTVLERCGARVRTAATAPEALAAAIEETPDVLLSDIAMPDQDGYALLAAVRRVAPRLPAVAVSAYASPEDHERALLAGFQAHLAKPIDPSHLTATVSALRAGARPAGVSDRSAVAP